MAASEGVHKRLGTVRNGLLGLHRALVRSERAVYERDMHKVTSSYHMLGLLLHDPWFDWLHELSRLIVRMDETLAERSISRAEAERLIQHARTLIRPTEDGDGFRRRYFEALQRDPEVILAHRQFKQVLGASA